MDKKLKEIQKNRDKLTFKEQIWFDLAIYFIDTLITVLKKVGNK